MTKGFVIALLAWYKDNHRDLPWRRTQDPYKIWLSEIMLQQTQVDTVIPYYLAFVKAYPRIEDLAKADVDQVLKLWEGLGYYSRAKRLIPCAKKVVEDHGGVFPKDLNQMLNLPGIGSYTAGAILGIAYNLKVPAVDGNVFRVVSRQDCIDLDIGKASSKKTFEARVASILPNDVRAFNQALMELGALVCTPKNPKCTTCPVSTTCKALAADQVNHYPVKVKKVKSVPMSVDVALISYGDKYLMYQKEPDGLIGGLWAFPYTRDIDQEPLADLVDQVFNISLKEGLVVGTTKHVFTHQTWHITVRLYPVKQATLVEYPLVKWVSVKEMKALPISTAMKRVINLI